MYIMYFFWTMRESRFVFRNFAYMGTNLTKSHEGGAGDKTIFFQESSNLEDNVEQSQPGRVIDAVPISASNVPFAVHSVDSGGV